MYQSRWSGVIVSATLTAVAVTAAVAQPGPAPVFVDVSGPAGVTLPGVLNESVAWGDYDNDGDQDLYLTNNGANNLFRNDGSGVFVDVTAAAGVGDTAFSVGTAFGDLDNDGDLDLYVVTFGAGGDVLYRNDGPAGPGGEYVFTDVALTADIDIDRSSRGVALVDYDRDGLLDIYVNAIGDDLLYHNLGSLQFQEVALTVLGTPPPGQGVGVVASDLDGNGWVDLFTGNRSSDTNALFMQHSGSFTDVARAAGIDKKGLGMGVLSLDYDNDLDLDLYWTTWPGDLPGLPNAFYENIDGASFTDVAQASGTGDATGWGISCNAGDVNNDGWEDFFVTNGFSDTSTPNVLFVNEGDGTFSDETVTLGGAAFDGRGVAFADYDEDGDLDLCVTAGPAAETRLWRNETATTNRWVGFKLLGTCSNRSAIGARIEVTTDLRTTVKEVSGGAGRGSQNSLPVEFGLGGATGIPRVTIFWPSGVVQQLADVELDDYRLVREPCGEFTLFMEDRIVRWVEPDYQGGGRYDLVRGDLTTLRRSGGDFTQATLDCLADGLAGPSQPHTDIPLAPGSGYWYLARKLVAGGGSYDEPSGAQAGSRDAEIDAAAGACP